MDFVLFKKEKIESQVEGKFGGTVPVPRVLRLYGKVRV